jgi:UDP-N-acetyl-alpha-D-muramoyl-L-alanyl-L-glutamate epimerase
MNKYQSFIFEAYEYDSDNHRITLSYSLGGVEQFVETITLPAAYPIPPVASSEELSAALFALHLIAGISYYKTCCPRDLIVRSGHLSPDQAAFWNSVYENGLGEFFYRNNIDFRGLISFPSVQSEQHSPLGGRELTITARAAKFLVPFGGGKDSIVTAEFLKRYHADCTLFRIGKHPYIDELAAIASLPVLNVERRLSPRLFQMNQEGALNGHVPATAYLSFLSLVTAILYGYTHIVMSNEKSASEGNVEFYGREINHQWSKGLHFERMFRTYLSRHITKSVQYINPLREFSELEIACLFSQLPQYFCSATSCNNNWRLATEGSQSVDGKRWCGKCPKCAFSFLLFAAFMPLTTVCSMFGENLFDKTELLPLYRQLLGLEGTKPFECVGTRHETQMAFERACNKPEWQNTTACQMWARVRDTSPAATQAADLRLEELGLLGFDSPSFSLINAGSK